MASIPLPALDVKPPEQQNPIDSLGRIVALKAALQNQGFQQQNQQFQQQMQPLELQSQKNQLQQQQMHIDSQKAFQQSLIANPGANPDDIGRAAIKGGALPEDVLPVVNQMKDSAIKTQTLRGNDLENATKQNAIYGQNANMLLNIQDPEKRAQVYQQEVLPTLVKAGFPPSAIPMQVPPDDVLKAHAAMSLNVDQQLDQARKNQTYEIEHGVIGPDKLGPLTQAMTARWQVLHPGQPLASAFQLPQGATWDDYKRIDGLMENTEKSSATQAQLQIANGYKAQASALANLAAQEKVAQLNKPTVAEQNRADLANNMTENLNQLESIIQRRPDLLGPVAGRMTALRGAVGTSDPDVAQLKDIKEFLGQAALGAHSMRNAGHIETAANSIINGLHNSPDATMQAIKAARNSLSTFQGDIDSARSGARSGITPNMVPGHPNAQPPVQAQPQQPSGPPAGATMKVPGSDGKLHWSDGKQDLGVAP